ncbi:MAG TPA: PAS domain-containing protein, partial [Candidatus Acidoferrales bacterium]|nr:PAS domain-containing protein [Candidatus Acidoferrales bacterium]
HPDDREAALERFDALLRDGTPMESEVRFVTPTRGVRLFRTRSLAVRNETGKIVRLRGMTQDVTEQREAERQLRERDAMLTHAEEIASLGSFQYDLATRKAILSTNLRNIFGLRDGEEWDPKACWERVHAEDRNRVRESMARGTESGKPFTFVMRFTPPGGAMRYLQVRGSPQSDLAGRPTQLIGIVQDITEQREAEEKLRERSALFEYAEKVAKLGSWRYDYSTDSFTLSPNMRQILGIGPDDSWSSELYWSRVHPADRVRAQAIFERATRERKPFEFIARFAPMNGGMAHLCTRGITFCDASGKLAYRVGVVQDVTAHHEAESKMREREALLAQAEEIANLGSWKYEFETDTLTLSAQLRKIYGLGENEAWTNDVYWSRVHPADREGVRQIVERATREKTPSSAWRDFFRSEARSGTCISARYRCWAPPASWCGGSESRRTSPTRSARKRSCGGSPSN